MILVLTLEDTKFHIKYWHSLGLPCFHHISVLLLICTNQWCVGSWGHTLIFDQIFHFLQLPLLQSFQKVFTIELFEKKFSENM